MLRSVVPFGFINVVALIFAPLMLAAVAHGRVAPDDMRIWIAAVWLGAGLQLVVLLARRSMMDRSLDRWEQAYGWVEAYIGASWGAALAVSVTSGDPLTYHLIVVCFLLMCTAAVVVAFAGSPHIGRRFFAGAWMPVILIGIATERFEVVGIALLIWPVATMYLVFATRLLRRSTVEQHRSKRLAQELAVQASTDDLTGLLNRRSTLQRIQQAMNAGHGVSALFIDLDGFKAINDRYGHATGDTVLLNVAEQLKNVARDTDVVGRLGGDEFVVILTDPADQHLADVIAERFAGEIARSHGAIHELAITASVGAARSIDGVTAEDLLGCADSAMYRAKSNGGNAAVHFLQSHLD